MSRCIDWPCCGHMENRCPEVKDNTCICGATLPQGHIDAVCKTCFDAWLENGNSALVFVRVTN